MTSYIKTLAPVSLSMRFLLSGFFVMLLAAYTLGSWVSRQIEAGVVQNYGTAAALYFESLIPQLPFPEGPLDSLPQSSKDILRSVLVDGVLKDRVVSYKVWSRDGKVLAAFDPTIEAQTYPVSEALTRAWQGNVSAQYEAVELHEASTSLLLELQLLGVYVPIRNTSTGEVGAVIEFYQRAEGLLSDIANSRQQTWLIVCAVFFISYAVLFGIVHAGSRLIAKQRTQLQTQLNHNTALKNRVAEAAARSTLQADRVMQRIGHDLHDGVAQHLSLLALRLDDADLPNTEDAQTVRTALANAMSELRAISRGLALPDIENLSPDKIVRRSVDDHRKAFGTIAEVSGTEDLGHSMQPSTKLALYRVVQELLTNVHKHARAEKIVVRWQETQETFYLTVADDGIGFDQTQSHSTGQGLIGIKDRLLPFGGDLDVKSALTEGTTVQITLPYGGNTLGN